MLRRLLIVCAVLALASSVAPAQPSVRIEPPTLQGPRALAEQTATSAVRNYLQSWQSLSAALKTTRIFSMRALPATPKPNLPMPFANRTRWAFALIMRTWRMMFRLSSILRRDYRLS